MELKRFHPVSEAVVPVTDCLRPRFPVIDFHTHCGKMLLGENYASLYDTKEYACELLKHGVVKAVNLDGLYGSDLDEMNRKGMLEKGDKIVMSGFGGGLTWASAVLEW